MGKLNLASIVQSAKVVISKHSPEILTGLGIAGMITTTVLAVKATPKALKLIDERKKEDGVEELTPVETVKAAWKCYIPAAVTCVASTACLIGASSVHLRRNAALATAYKLSETALTEYREKVVETIGEKKEELVRDKVAQEQVNKNPVHNNEVYITDKGDTLFLDPLSKRYFKGNIDRIRRAENKLNKSMLHDMFGYVSLNDFYDEIGLEQTELGERMGWNTDKGLIDIHFSPSITKDDQPCLVIDHRNAPTWDYDKFR